MSRLHTQFGAVAISRGYGVRLGLALIATLANWAAFSQHAVHRSP
jgi:hypothetical protein